ncbi:MAG: hypothetical protein K8I30_22525, partial [Anaerolineae bacterium]|nr:hypothetical protein [Anaerolineae bacterium]
EEPTVEATEPVVVVPTEETPTKPVEQSGPYDNLTQAVGKDVSVAAPPSPEELASAQDAPNNNFSAAQPVTLNGAGFYVFTNGTVDATLEASEPIPVCGDGLDKTVWFSFDTASVGAGADTYTFSTATSSFDTIMGIYTGATLPTLTAFGCNDDGSTSVVTSQLKVNLAASTTYYIQVGGFNGRYGALSFRVQKGAVPAALAAPVLVSPNTNLTTNLTTPTFTWNKVTNANSYEVQVATNAAFTANLQTAFVSSGVCGTTCSYLLTPALTTPATYYWRVRGRNLNDLNGAFSAARTYIYRTAPPTLSLPAANAVSTTSKPALKWIAYPGASYTVQIDDDPGFGSPLNSPTYFAPTPATAITFTPPTSLPQGDWYWRVAATPLLGTLTDYSPSRKFTVNISSLPANNAVATLVGAATSANVNFKWIAVVGATGYAVKVDDNIDFSSPLNAPTFFVPSPATGLTLTTPLPAGVYYWYVVPTGF